MREGVLWTNLSLRLTASGTPASRRTIRRQEYQATGDPVISIDTNKKELPGNFHRDGQTYTEQTVETFDHDFPSAGQGKLIPHGVYDLAREQASIHKNTSHDTGERCCDS